MTTRTCYRCKEVKPLEEFPRAASKPKGHDYLCKPCKVVVESERKRQTPGLQAEASRAQRAGIRLNKCAVCSTSIQGRGLCVTCEECVEVLGGLEGLKRAVRAVRYLSGK
ncbi:endonuclease VII [Streptomyces phage Rowa]|uniref:HNH endonuclease n=1 Tax=Streptomyces phage Rowa TaxID=2059883 RepID=A0A2H5BM08_9CAUD|nr:endonuclease VII [Streptomyces phage Rowa]AUG87324.1 HNH endonuclease [Streptomyces phage Rowa]